MYMFLMEFLGAEWNVISGGQFVRASSDIQSVSVIWLRNSDWLLGKATDDLFIFLNNYSLLV